MDPPPSARAATQAVEARPQGLRGNAPTRTVTVGGRSGRLPRTTLVASRRQGSSGRPYHPLLRPTGSAQTCRLTSTFRTAGCGPACPVMWQGSSGAPCGPISVTFLLWKIEQQNLSVFGRRQFQLLLVDDFRTVTFCEIDPVEAYLSAGHVYVCLPAFLDFFLNQFSATDRADIQLDILIGGQCAVGALRRRDQT